MEIDISKVGDGHELSNYELNILKAAHLYKEINNINIVKESEFNYIIMPMAVFNIIELNPLFKMPTEDEHNRKDGIFFVGNIGEFSCYVDMYMDQNNILIRYDKQISRDNKLRALLDNINIVNEVSIDVNY